VFSRKDDAQRVMDVLPKRFEKYGLTLHPDKTRLLDFRRPLREGRLRKDTGAPAGAFNFLGFTFHWAMSRKGNGVVMLRTASRSLTRALQSARKWCRRFMHYPIEEQHRGLIAKANGHYAYFGITGNYARLSSFIWELEYIWRKWLGRRSQRGSLGPKRWVRFLERHPLPQPRIVHEFSIA
jgi:hypothetical protein